MAAAPEASLGVKIAGQDGSSSSPQHSRSLARQLVDHSPPPPDAEPQQPSGNNGRPSSQSFSLEIMDVSSLEKHRRGESGDTNEGGEGGEGGDKEVYSKPSENEVISYKEVDYRQKEQFEALLKKESSIRRSCLHKGLVFNVLFLVVMVVGILLGELLYPLEGVRGNRVRSANDSQCLNQTAGCITVRLVRAVGVFGFLGGITNWIAIEMLFRSVPLLIGTGVLAKRYKEVRECIRQIVVDTLFDPMALKKYFSEGKKSVREMLHLETHFGSLLNSDAANQIIERKINSALARPEGFILTMMGVDNAELKLLIRRHIDQFIAEISPAILDQMAAPGLSDGLRLQAEVVRILEERTEELSSKKVKQLVAVMIHKHLSWLVVWGNLFGAVIGIVAEVIAIVVSKYAE